MIWVVATVAVMAVLAFRIAAAGSDLPQPIPTDQLLSPDTETSLLIGNLASDPALAARAGDSGIVEDAVLVEIKTSDGFEDLEQ